MQRAALVAEQARVERRVVVEQLVREVRSRAAERGERVEPFVAGPCLFGDVEPDEGEVRKARVEHQIGGLRVVEEVRVGVRGDVPRHGDRAAHDHDGAEQVRQVRFEQDREGDVGQRAQREEGQLAGLGSGQPDELLGGRTRSSALPAGRRPA